VPALIEIPALWEKCFKTLLKSTIIQKTMHFRIDSNGFVRGYLKLGE
jgi:hypothetical protein